MNKCFCQENPLAYERKSKFLKERPLNNVVVIISAPASPHRLSPPAVPDTSLTFACWKSLDAQASPGSASPSCLYTLWALGLKYLLLSIWKFLSIFKIQFRYYFLQGDFLNLFPHTELIMANAASLHWVQSPGAYS